MPALLTLSSIGPPPPMTRRSGGGGVAAWSMCTAVHGCASLHPPSPRCWVWPSTTRSSLLTFPIPCGPACTRSSQGQLAELAARRQCEHPGPRTTVLDGSFDGGPAADEQLELAPHLERSFLPTRATARTAFWRRSRSSPGFVRIRRSRVRTRSWRWPTSGSQMVSFAPSGTSGRPGWPGYTMSSRT